MSAAELIVHWESLGSLLAVRDRELFVIDAPAVPAAASNGSSATEAGPPPLLVLHGFPTSSIDFAQVLPALQAGRRVVLFDFLGFGMSAKPDQAYSLFEQADLAEAVVAHLGLDRVDLLTHDIGDSVGAELLHRSLERQLGFEIRRRVMANGSIYFDLTQFSDGQRFLLDLPDVAFTPADAPDVDAISRSLEGTFGSAPASDPDPDLVRAASDLVVVSGGNRLLPRTIRYIEERRHNGERWADAITRHDSPLAVVWGDADPIAVWPMVERLANRRPETAVTRLAEVGHYPMVEAPAAFAQAVLAHL
jgi:pimeloyl-ACP methyl ester carboxylesterase